jgi:tellurite resistance protein TerC
MIGLIQITPWHWAAFILFVLFFLALDLGVFHRGSHTLKFKEAFAWSALWFLLAMLFAGALFFLRGREESVQFTTGYLIELSLSLDNILVIALIFSAFRVPPEFQHRVLFWGILGALVMRGAMIAVGVALIHRFGWLLYVFGAFLVFTGVKMSFSDKDAIDPEKNPVLRLARKFFSVTPDFAGRKFFTRTGGRFLLTPLALVLLLVETTDLIFAVDSVPAVFSVTQNAFIVFTSNVFAILGLRSLYFVLAGALGYFRYLKFGLSVVLVFVGAKMLLDPHRQPEKWFQVEIPTNVSLMIVGTVVLIAIVLSTMVAEREKRTKQTGKNINHG